MQHGTATSINQKFDITNDGSLCLPLLEPVEEQSKLIFTALLGLTCNNSNITADSPKCAMKSFHIESVDTRTPYLCCAINVISCCLNL